MSFRSVEFKDVVRALRVIIDGVVSVNRYEGETKRVYVEVRDELRNPRNPATSLWVVWDNGGEIGVRKVNSREISRFVPSEWDIWTHAVNAATVAVRVAEVFGGGEIDFEWSISDEDAAIMMGEEPPFIEDNPAMEIKIR